MICRFVQTKKELFGASFEAESEGNVFGKISFKGRIGSIDGVWTIECFNQTIVLSPKNKFFQISSAKKYRPYTVFINEEERAEIYQTFIRTGGLSRAEYHTMRFGECEYNLFSISLGEEGCKSPIFENDVQIAQVDKACLVYNDLHHFEIFSLNQDKVIIALIFCCYMYTLGCYNAGEKSYKSVSKFVSVTKNEFLKSKYDPNFKSKLN